MREARDEGLVALRSRYRVCLAWLINAVTHINEINIHKIPDISSSLFGSRLTSPAAYRLYWHVSLLAPYRLPKEEYNKIIYRKILKISPGAYIFKGPFRFFQRGLYSEGLIYEGKFEFQKRSG